MINRKFIFLGSSFLAKPASYDYYTTSSYSLTKFVRMFEAVDGNKCSQFHRANIVRVSCECCLNVVQHVCDDSWDNRTTFVQLSQICLNTHSV